MPFSIRPSSRVPKLGRDRYSAAPPAPPWTHAGPALPVSELESLLQPKVMTTPPSSASKASLLMFKRSSPQARDIPAPRRHFACAPVPRLSRDRQASEIVEAISLSANERGWSGLQFTSASRLPPRSPYLPILAVISRFAWLPEASKARSAMMWLPVEISPRATSKRSFGLSRSESVGKTSRQGPASIDI